MCGIIGILLANEDAFVNQLLVDGLTVLQHRGQDAAGMVTADNVSSSPVSGSDPGSDCYSSRLHLRKDNGLVKDVFQQHHMLELRGHVGLGHCRYPTAGSHSCAAEAQPLYTNYPYGICVAHNGNITNTDALRAQLRERNVVRHINTDSDSELLLNVFAEALTQQTRNNHPLSSNGATAELSSLSMTEAVLAAMTSVMNRCKGGYAGLFLINGVGLVGFRDPHGIRPLVMGVREREQQQQQLRTDSHHSSHNHSNPMSMRPNTPSEMQTANRQLDYCFASESVAIDTLGFRLIRDVRAGEAIFIDMQHGNCHSRVVHAQARLSPCIFEYVYFARPDSIMDGVSVYESRLNMGTKLADNILKRYPNHAIDVVIPIPDTSRTAALQAAYRLDRPFREGFIKNRYIARTFIMPGQATRRKSVRMKLNTIKSEFVGKNVLLVDDSIVRGTTASEIVQMARDAGAKKVFFCSAAPPIRFPNIYGIDIPTRHELIAFNRNEDEIAQEIGCDWVLYQDLHDLQQSILECKHLGNSPSSTDLRKLHLFDTSCFSGEYVTGETIGDDYFTKLHDERNDQAQQEKRKRSGISISSSSVNGSSSSSSSSLHRRETSSSSLQLPPLPRSSSSSSLPSSKKPMQSNDGCESVSNDKRHSLANGSSGCETLTNKPTSEHSLL